MKVSPYQDDTSRTMEERQLEKEKGKEKRREVHGFDTNSNGRPSAACHKQKKTATTTTTTTTASTANSQRCKGNAGGGFF